MTEIAGLLRRQWLLIAAATVLALGAGLAYLALRSPSYVASASISFNDLSEDLEALETPIPESLDPIIPAGADATVVTSPRVVSLVSASLGSDQSREQALAAVETSVDPGADVLTIEASADSAQLAARLANGFAREAAGVATSELRGNLRRAAGRLAGEATDSDSDVIEAQVAALDSLAAVARPVRVQDVASPPEDSESPGAVAVIGLALGLGLIAGLIAAALRESASRLAVLGRRRPAPREVQRLRIPLPGRAEAEAFDKGNVMSNNGSAMSNGKPEADDRIETFRILRSNLDFLSPEKKLRIVGITSPLSEEGKSTVAAGIAVASALAGKRTLLVECDLRRPVLAKRFEVSPEPGLVDWIADKASPAEVLRQVTIDDETAAEPGELTATETAARPLDLVVAGSTAPRPAEFLGSSRFKKFLAQVREVYDLVILDCAPLLLVGDTLEVIPEVDATLICIRLVRTTEAQAHAAKSAIEHFPERPTAIIVTGERPGADSDSYYGYGYYGSVAGPSQA